MELTESVLAENIEGIIETMLVLKTKGMRFSLDDVGTGYSSLSYLSRLPLEQLKIDLSFVRNILTDKNAAAIAKTIVALGKSLGMEVIAEGVVRGAGAGPTPNQPRLSRRQQQAQLIHFPYIPPIQCMGDVQTRILN